MECCFVDRQYGVACSLAVGSWMSFRCWWASLDCWTRRTGSRCWWWTVAGSASFPSNLYRSHWAISEYCFWQVSSSSLSSYQCRFCLNHSSLVVLASFLASKLQKLTVRLADESWLKRIYLFSSLLQISRSFFTSIVVAGEFLYSQKDSSASLKANWWYSFPFTWLFMAIVNMIVTLERFDQISLSLIVLLLLCSCSAAHHHFLVSMR